MQVRRWMRWIDQQPAWTVLAFALINQAFGVCQLVEMGTDGGSLGVTTTRDAHFMPMTISPVDSTSSWPFSVNTDQVREG